MPTPEQRFNDFRKIVRWFVKEEVKTPLSFFFKVIPYMTAAWVAVLYAPGIDGHSKISLVKFSAEVFGGLCVFVGAFAFLRPKYLVYGESGHRAEKKLEFGTESKSYTIEEMEELPSKRNAPASLSAGEVEPR
jgi:hypothetical protein